MNRFFSIFSIIVFSAVLSLAQGPDDHDDGAPIQAGYAVVTPLSAAPSGLVVFETFGLRSNGGQAGAAQAGVLPPALTTNAVLFVESSERLSKNLGVAIVNPNDSSVEVTMTLHKSDGTTFGTTTVTVPPHQQTSKFVTELLSSQTAVSSDFTGTLTVNTAGFSNLPVSMIGLRFRGANFSTLPLTSLSGTTAPLPAIAAGVGGAGAVLLPQFAVGGGWATELIITNTAASSLAVRLDLFKQDGTALIAALNGRTGSSFTDLIIPAGGVLVMAPRNSNGDDDF